MSFRYNEQLGRLLCGVGGLIYIIAYLMPWMTFPSEGDSRFPTTSGWSWASAGGSPFFSVALNVIPLFMSGMALLIALQPSSSRLLWRLFWLSVILGTAELLLQLNDLDPLGLNPETLWVLQRLPTPTLGPGLYLIIPALLAIVIGGWLSRSPRVVQA